MRFHTYARCIAATLSLAALAMAGCGSLRSATPTRKIGVVYVFHGGSEVAGTRSSWEATLQIFVYDPNSPIYRNVIWNAERWPQILGAGNAPKELSKYEFSYGRIGGIDPANRHTLAMFERFRALLEARERALGVDFVVDYASWLAPDPRHHIYPRLIYTPRVPGGSPVTYCQDDWSDCDPQRFDVDGTIERLLAAGVDEIHMVDLTTSGVRFFKSWDVVNLARQVVDRHNARSGASVSVRWVNDPHDLMTNSYPLEPERWTLSKGPPVRDRSVQLKGHPNPVASSPRLAAVQVNGIEARWSASVPLARTGVLLVNHATREGNQTFDPKIDDTLVLNDNIRRELLRRHPELDSRNILAAWFGRRQHNTVTKRPERTREMRGENLGDAYLYESEDLPQGWQGYLYWQALQQLKAQGVQHMVIAFPQIMIDSVLNLVELPNQIGKEIGWRNWARIESLDFDTYPGAGHPFADYWGNWVDSRCPARTGTGTEPCCFEMGGCADGRPYPPARTTPPDRSRDDLDPSLAFDVSDFGHLGYDPARGPVDSRQPLQDQYRGSWDIWQPPNDAREVAELLADAVAASVAAPGLPPPARGIPLHGL